MFDKLDDILMRLEEVLNQLSEPDVAADAAKFQKLMKEQAELQPIADAYKDYKTQKQTIEESLMLLEEESDEEMREMLKEWTFFLSGIYCVFEKLLNPPFPLYSV